MHSGSAGISISIQTSLSQRVFKRHATFKIMLIRPLWPTLGVWPSSSCQ